ncbi:MAG: RHS repeat-associated core domain-containing protein, partial [Dehalococcoidia bacterium]|nr:RHS repeat-associated core domain-containing protein [Dehalococcoidia bacterium]
VLGQVVEVLDPHGALTRYEYDEPSLQRSAEIDALGHAIRTTYDALGRPTRVVDRDGATTVLHYDEHPHEACFSTPCREESPAGGVWRYEHDAFGNVKSETDPLGFTRTYAYARGQLASMRSAGGRETRFFRDTQCNVVRVDDASRVFTLTCDGWGRVTSITDPLGATTRYRLDEAGNILARFLPDGSEWQYVPDGECNVVRTIGPRSEAAFAFDGHYELNTVTHPDGSEVHLEHDSEDDLTAVVNENGDVYRFELDARGDVQKEVGFDGVFRRYVRDELRRVVRVYHQKKPGTDYDAKYADLTYDACGRLTRVDLFDGLAFEPVAFERYAYDAAGLLVEAENECSLVRFERDLLGRVTKEIVRHGGEERWVASTYSPDGERTSRVTSLGHREVYLRNVHGEVEELETGTAHRPVSWRFERNDLGQEVERHFPGGAREQRIYHPGSHLPKRRVLVDARGETVGETLYNWSGTRLQKEWRRGFALRHFDHDARDRLVASREALDEQRTAWRTTWRCPDPAGNLFFDPQLTSAEYGPGGVLREAGGTRYETNLRGERIAEHYADDTSRLLSWNAAGRLERVQMPDGTEVSFEYDALGRRLAKRVQTPEPERGGEGRAAETAWLWDGDVPVHERGSDAAWATWMHEPDTFAPLGRRDGKGFSSIATDYLGNPTEGLDELGQLVWAMQLDVFGVPHGLEGPGRACPWRFPGQYEDAETGLFYNRHRYYAPGEGGYLSVDPIGLWGGPHLYGYTADPLSAIDPLGLVPSPGAGEPLYVGSYSRSRYGNQRTGLAQSYTPHHVVQDAVSPVSHGRGITINIPKLVHERTLTMRRRRPQMTLWNHLLQDVHELRALLLAYGFPRNLVNQQLRQLVQQHIDRDGLTKLKTCRR